MNSAHASDRARLDTPRGLHCPAHIPGYGCPCVKTTIEIPDALAAKTRACGTRERITLRSLVEEGLREVLRASGTGARVRVEGCERRRPRLAAGVSGRRLAADPRRRLRGPEKSTAAAANVLAPNRFRRPVTRCSPEPDAAGAAASPEMMAWSGACPGFEFVKRDAAPVADHPAHPAGGVASGLPAPAPNRRAPGQDGVRGCGDGSRWRLPWRLVRLERLESPSTSCAGADGTAQWTGFRRWMGGTGRETEAGTRGLEPGPLPAGGRESSGRAAGDDG